MSRHRLATIASLVVLAAPAARLHAQPACTPGTLSSYLALASCTVGALTFSDFRLKALGTYADPRVLYTLPDPDLVLVTPGQMGNTVALAFANLVTSLTVTAPTPADSAALIAATLRFDVLPLPGSVISAARTSFAGVAPDPSSAAVPRAHADFGLSSLYDGSDQCAHADPAPVDGPYDVDAPCVPPVADPGAEYITHLLVDAADPAASRTDPVTLAPGSASIALDGVAFDLAAVTAVPEPGSRALLAAGLLATGAATVRRRRRPA